LFRVQADFRQIIRLARATLGEARRLLAEADRLLGG